MRPNNSLATDRGAGPSALAGSAGIDAGRGTGIGGELAAAMAGSTIERKAAQMNRITGP
jgi:hypothetical protein